MDPIQRLLDEIIDDVRPLDWGETAQYIPELADADPTPVAMAAVGPRGRVVSTGDDHAEFTIQSISKPYVLALALAERGRDDVLARVGVEPSGEPFNAISLEVGTGRPANPLVNAGAIATTGLIPGDDLDERSAWIAAGLSRFAGRSLWVDESVYSSESATGDRNRALAHLLKSYGIIDGDVRDVVESYFRQCSLLVTVRDLAVMAATLSCGGRNPVTGEQVVSREVARDVVAIMTSCGMYDSSGEWLLRVGLPAKSGVSGGILAVSPSQFGVGVFSPRLDQHGNSVRGQQLLKRLSDDLALHVFELHEGLGEPGVAITRGADGIHLKLVGQLAVSGVDGLLDDVQQLVSGGEVVASVQGLGGQTASAARDAATRGLTAMGVDVTEQSD